MDSNMTVLLEFFQSLNTHVDEREGSLKEEKTEAQRNSFAQRGF